jgi:hypothetical protein
MRLACKENRRRDWLASRTGNGCGERWRAADSLDGANDPVLENDAGDEDE